MSRPDLLWINLTRSRIQAELPVGFSSYFHIRLCADSSEIDQAIAHYSPKALCFDFDYPDKAGLRFLLDTKRNYASLPIVMLTLQHSEALAIWAFRSKVWDYLVKPVPRFETDRCLGTLLSLRRLGPAQRGRIPATQSYRLPTEVSIRQKPWDEKLAPAVFYVEQYYRSKVSVDDVSKICRMSPFRFSREFKKTFGKTFRDYLIDYRLKEACRLLENPAATITDVTYAVGFNDPSYFSRVFKQRFGVTPSLMVGTKDILSQMDTVGLEGSSSSS